MSITKKKQRERSVHTVCHGSATAGKEEVTVGACTCLRMTHPEGEKQAEASKIADLSHCIKIDQIRPQPRHAIQYYEHG